MSFAHGVMPPVLQLTSAEARPIADYLPSSTAQIDWFSALISAGYVAQLRCPADRCAGSRKTMSVCVTVLRQIRPAAGNELQARSEGPVCCVAAEPVEKAWLLIELGPPARCLGPGAGAIRPSS